MLSMFHCFSAYFHSPLQPVEDAEFPWHCNCDVESSAYNAPIPACVPEERISDRITTGDDPMADDAANNELRARLESTLLRDERLLKTFNQPRAVLEQMKECGTLRTLFPSSETPGEQSNSDNDFFDSVD